MVELWANQVIKKRVLILIATVLLLVVSIISAFVPYGKNWLPNVRSPASKKKPNL